MKLPTFSEIHRVMQCPGSWLLPHVQRTPGKAAQRGSEIHQRFFVEPESFKECHDWLVKGCDDFSDVPFEDKDAYFGEHAFAFDPSNETTDSLGIDIGREYEKHGADQSEEFCGTIDAMTISKASGRKPPKIRLMDLKTGKTPGDLWQLKAQAVAVSYYFLVYDVTACFAYVTDTFLTRIEEHHWNAMDLDIFADDMAQLKIQLQTMSKKGGYTFNEGSHCTYCKALTVCPAKQSGATITSGIDEPRTDR